MPLGTPEVTAYSYDALGNLDTVRLPNSVVSDFDYDERNRLTRLRHFEDANDNSVLDGGETLLAEFEYTLRADGRRSRVVVTNDLGSVTTIDWVYDEMGRLVEEHYDAEGTEFDSISRYVFDLVGNRVSLAQDLGNADPLSFVADEWTEYLYDDNDRLVTELKDAPGTADDRNIRYTYEGTQQASRIERQGITLDQGAIVQQTAYAYGVQGRLAEVVIDSDGNGAPNSTSAYSYNDQGIRTRQTVNGQTTVYLVDQNNHTGHAQVLEEKNGTTGAVTKTYILGHDVIAQQAPGVAGGQTLYLVYDGHGSTRQLVGATGQPIAGQAFAYDAYGNAIDFDPTAAHTTLLYSGEQTDTATGQQYLRARYYDPGIGRFGAMDPYSGDLQSPLSLHKYLYTSGDPINLIDPSGMFGIAGLVGGFSIANSIRNIKLETDLLAFDAVSAAVQGIQARQTADQIVESFIADQLFGFGVGFIGGMALQAGGTIWEHGVSIVQSAFRRGSGSRPLVILNSGAFHFASDARDMAVRGLRAPDIRQVDVARINSAFRDPTQRLRAQEWVDWAKSNRAVDIRINQTQVSTTASRLGINRPDLQFTLNGGTRYELPNGAVIEVPQGAPRRIYVEFDGMSSGRGPAHFRRIMANDPHGAVILETNAGNRILESITLP